MSLGQKNSQMGWIVWREKPWDVWGPYAAYDDAVQTAEIAGTEWKVAYGEIRSGTSDFIHMEAPSDA